MFGFCVGLEQEEAFMQEWTYMAMNFALPLWVRGETNLKSVQKGPMPDLPVVMAAPLNGRPNVVAGDQPLTDFEHPEECIYWFGGVHEIVLEEPPRTIARVYIPMPEMLPSPTAGAIFLWDRMVKRGESDHR
jgi:hypothetical protein